MVELVPRLGLLKKGSWKAEAEVVKKQTQRARDRKRAEETLWCPVEAGLRLREMVGLRHHVVHPLDTFKAPRTRVLAAADGVLTEPIILEECRDWREAEGQP